MIHRYVEQNVRRSGTYRNCNKVLPEWLHDKPQKFTRHCRERIALGKAIKKRDSEVRSMKCLIFQIHSSANNDIYTITLGDKTTMPQCTCENWGKSSMPCKHMFAVMDHIECVSCVSFLEKYTQSPFLRLKNNIEKSQVKEAKYNELKKGVFMKRSKASTSRELLNHIKTVCLWCTIMTHLTIYTMNY